jgi:hypothetical protein
MTLSFIFEKKNRKISSLLEEQIAPEVSKELRSFETSGNTHPTTASHPTRLEFVTTPLCEPKNLAQVRNVESATLA